MVSLYAGYALLGFLGLMLVGMEPFDALNHAFAAVSTGGFSTRGASIGHRDSPGIEGVTIVFFAVARLSRDVWHMLTSG